MDKPTFDGSRDVGALDTFQLKLELYLDDCGWTEQDKIRFVIGQLSGEAIAFWRRTAQPIPTTHWTEVINTLRTYFVPLTIGTDLYKALERLWQGNTPPFEFLKQFDEHASCVSNMSDAEYFRLLRGRVNSRAREELARALGEHLTRQEIVQALLEAHSIGHTTGLDDPWTLTWRL
ncbi:hypothetical protein AMAG_06453 [Allomyces macrogynus ATCC 38327]|uniref:Retrotransposon gag domain-containing protein n=1 Tax=Allomyces macrogynus (strain ATCC 38327) TaxID=578462 RepID=A0A0L0SGK2_ALLM3|nr:hypothetical protein AMAG_06453 [Allomyces macrogynus ATCC 38327]|eukprot:KNE61643.1 hypothetical protein AMAG_06453 [Allomyces macrogynus ATCC 38327]